MTNTTVDCHKVAVKTALQLLFTASIPFEQKRREITKHIDPEMYIQHSPGIGNGLESLLALVEELDKRLDTYSVEVIRLIAEGEFVVAHCLYKFGKDTRGTAIAEIFRLENGKMVEHWDVIQDVPDESKSKNSNGML